MSRATNSFFQVNGVIDTPMLDLFKGHVMNGDANKWAFSWLHCDASGPENIKMNWWPHWEQKDEVMWVWSLTPLPYPPSHLLTKRQLVCRMKQPPCRPFADRGDGLTWLREAQVRWLDLYRFWPSRPDQQASSSRRAACPSHRSSLLNWCGQHLRVLCSLFLARKADMGLYRT